LNACSKPDYHTTDGASGNFSDLRGKWLFVNYWAQWCAPCIKEMPELNRFQQQYAAQANVFAVNYDNASGAELQQQVKKLSIELRVFEQDPAVQFGYQRTDVLPVTYVFNPEGKLTATLNGPQTVESLAAAMAQPNSTPASAP
jgi:thiol-disulfide isomerase/thioredoxin